MGKRDGLAVGFGGGDGGELAQDRAQHFLFVVVFFK